MVTLRVIDSDDWLQMLKTETKVTNICTKIEQVILADENVGIKLYEAIKILLSYDCNMNHENTVAVMTTLKVVVEHVAGKLGGACCEKSLNVLDSDAADFFFQIIEELTSHGTIFNSKHGFDRDNEDGQHTAGSGSDEDVVGAVPFDPEWRTKIGFADWVDFFDEERQVWVRAQIIEENPYQFKYRIQPEGVSAYYAEWIEIFSERIAPEGTETRKHTLLMKRFQRKINLGDKVDAKTRLGQWKAGEIIEIDRKQKKCKIRFDGFTEISDEWVNHYENDLAPLNTHKSQVRQVNNTARGTESSGVLDSMDHFAPETTAALYELDDANDPDDFRFLYRRDEIRSLSPRVCEVITLFAKADGFHGILSSHQFRWSRIETIVKIFANISASASRSFVASYFSKAADIISKALKSIRISDLRNINISKIDQLVLKLTSQILPRVFEKRAQTMEYIERFYLSFASTWLKCNLLPRRLDGLKRLTELANLTKQYAVKKASWLTASHFQHFLRQEELLFEMFKVGQHVEVIKRSGDILKSLSHEGFLLVPDVKLIWSAAGTPGRDVDTRTEIYKTISGLCTCMAFEEMHFLFFAGAFAAETKHTINKQKLMLMAELGQKAPFKSDDAGAQIGKLLLQFSMIEPLIDGAMDAIMLFVSSHFGVKEHRSAYMLACFQNIIVQVHVKPTLVLLPRLVKTFPEKLWQISDTNPTQASIVRSLESDGKGVVDFVLSLPKYYMDDILGFLIVFLPISEEKISPSQIRSLWIEDYHETLCKWVTQPEVSDLFENETEQYIIENILCRKEHLQDVSVVEFQCLEELVYRINQKERLCFREGGNSIVIFGTNFVCIDSVWDCAVFAKNQVVLESAKKMLLILCDVRNWDSTLTTVCFRPSQFFEQKFLSVKSSGIKSDQYFEDPWRVHIATCCEYMSRSSVLDHGHFTQNCIALLAGILDQSEKEGLKGLRAHVHRARGRKVQLCVKYLEQFFFVHAYANDTLWELKEAIADRLNMETASLNLYVTKRDGGSRTFEDHDQSKTLLQNNFRQNESLSVTKKCARVGPKNPEILPTPLGTVQISSSQNEQTTFTEPVHASLLVGNSRPTVAFEAALTSIFRQHCTTEGMSFDNIIEYFKYCGASGDSLVHSRINEILRKFDHITLENKSILLTKTGFIQFYSSQAKKKAGIFPRAVWDDLKTHGYTNNLIKSILSSEGPAGDPAHLSRRAPQDLPRYWLVYNPKYSSIIFNLLNHTHPVASSMAWDLVMRLPTNPERFEAISSLKGVNGSDDWDLVLQRDSPYTLIYSLQIIEYLVDPVGIDDSNEEEKNSPPGSPTRNKNVAGDTIVNSPVTSVMDNAAAPQTWKNRFFRIGGFKYLLDTFLSRGRSNHPSLDNLITGLLLKLIRAFMLAAMSTKGNNCQDILELVRERSCQNKPLALTTKFPELSRSRSESEIAHDSLQAMLRQSVNIQSGGRTSLSNTTISPAVSALLVDLGTTPPPGEELLSLVRQLSQGGSSTLGDNLLQKIDFSIFQCRLFEIMQDSEAFLRVAISPSDIYVTRRNIERAVGLWVASAMYDERVFPEFTHSDKLLKAYFLCLISPIHTVRREVAHAARVLSCAGRRGKENETPAVMFLKYLLDRLPTSTALNLSSDTTQYDFFYDLTAALLADVFKIKRQAFNPEWQFPLLAKCMCQTVLEFDDSVFGKNCKIVHVVGAMHVLKTMLSMENEIGDIGIRDACDGELVKHLIGFCIFSVKITEKSSVSSASLGLLKSLCFRPYTRLKGQHSAHDSDMLIMEFDEEDDLNCGAFGINCALGKPESELLLFVVKELDDVHFSIQNSAACKTSSSRYFNPSYVRTPNNHIGMRNLGSTCYLNSVCQQLYAIREFREGILMSRINSNTVTAALQSMFWRMLLTKRSYVETGPICKKFKFNNNGGELNVQKQEDAIEFYQRLLDIVEINLKDSKESNFVKNILIGTTKTRYTCSACKRTIDKEQNLNCLELEVKNRGNFKDSMDAFTEPEALSGYLCEACNSRSTTKKRCLLGTLPPILFCSLKRFELNYETFMREKVGSIAKDDGTGSQETWYDLNGVIIHSGDAQSGHYYSYLKNSDGMWIECNDQVIRPWNVETRLEPDCFGGSTSSEMSYQKPLRSSSSAYMLVYRKCVHVEEDSDGELKAKLNLKSLIPTDLGEIIRADNAIIDTIRVVYRPPYLNFLAELIVCIGENATFCDITDHGILGHIELERQIGLFCFVLRAVVHIFRHTDDHRHMESASTVLLNMFRQNVRWRRFSSIVFD